MAGDSAGVIPLRMATSGSLAMAAANRLFMRGPSGLAPLLAANRLSRNRGSVATPRMARAMTRRSEKYRLFRVPSPFQGEAVVQIPVPAGNGWRPHWAADKAEPYVAS